nr:hypothetical protein [uncultured Bacteroides sp.]
MIHWVYISKNSQGVLKIALSDDTDKLLSEIKPDEQIVYLRPFKFPFDALAHKHLLGALSKKSVLFLIKKYGKETKELLNFL